MREILHVPYEKAYAIGFEDMHRRVPDITKIKRCTSWAPGRNLDEILRDVIREPLDKSTIQTS
jgi:UDP-glucose 4-epimerase